MLKEKIINPKKYIIKLLIYYIFYLLFLYLFLDSKYNKILKTLFLGDITLFLVILSNMLFIYITNTGKRKMKFKYQLLLTLSMLNKDCNLNNIMNYYNYLFNKNEIDKFNIELLVKSSLIKEKFNLLHSIIDNIQYKDNSLKDEKVSLLLDKLYNYYDNKIILLTINYKSISAISKLSLDMINEYNNIPYYLLIENDDDIKLLNEFFQFVYKVILLYKLETTNNLIKLDNEIYIKVNNFYKRKEKLINDYFNNTNNN